MDVGFCLLRILYQIYGVFIKSMTFLPWETGWLTKYPKCKMLWFYVLETPTNPCMLRQDHLINYPVRRI